MSIMILDRIFHEFLTFDKKCKPLKTPYHWPTKLQKLDESGKTKEIVNPTPEPAEMIPQVLGSSAESCLSVS